MGFMTRCMTEEVHGTCSVFVVYAVKFLLVLVGFILHKQVSGHQTCTMYILPVPVAESLRSRVQRLSHLQEVYFDAHYKILRRCCYAALIYTI